MTRQIGLARLLCILILFAVCSSAGRANEVDFSAYHRAAEFCRGDVERPLALDPDHRVLCFDGALTQGMDVSLPKSLEPNGLFVVRSTGGDVMVAAALADIVRDQHATVVVYDYCFSACASFLLVASHEAFVLRNTLVAWHYHFDSHLCPRLVVIKEGDPMRLETSPCPDAPPEIRQREEYGRYLNFKF